MTAVLAIDYLYQVIVLADCRVTWLAKPPTLQDNLQKVYPLGPTGIIGFAGDVAAAKVVLRHIKSEASVTKLPPTALGIVDHISKWARQSYSNLPLRDNNKLELMYAAADYGNVIRHFSNITLAKNILVKFVSPNFEPENRFDFVALGYAVKYPPEDIRKQRNDSINLGLNPLGQKLLAVSSAFGYREVITKIGEDTVGGTLFGGNSKCTRRMLGIVLCWR